MKIIIEADNAEVAKWAFDLWLQEHKAFPKNCLFRRKDSALKGHYAKRPYGYKIIAWCPIANPKESQNEHP